MTALIYVAAICAANASVYTWGPVATPINAFLLIGLDLTLRDRLHDRYGLVGSSALALVAAGASYGLNPAGATIALASAVSFALASLADGSLYQALRGRNYLTRSNGSNTAGALVDSLTFPTIAFGVLMSEVIALQFVAKVAGGFMWSLLLRKWVVA